MLLHVALQPLCRLQRVTLAVHATVFWHTCGVSMHQLLLAMVVAFCSHCTSVVHWYSPRSTSLSTRRATVPTPASVSRRAEAVERDRLWLGPGHRPAVQRRPVSVSTDLTAGSVVELAVRPSGRWSIPGSGASGTTEMTIIDWQIITLRLERKGEVQHNLTVTYIYTWTVTSASRDHDLHCVSVRPSVRLSVCPSIRRLMINNSSSTTFSRTAFTDYRPAVSSELIGFVYVYSFSLVIVCERNNASAVLAVIVWPSVCLSVCLSVTGRCSTKTAKHRTMQTTPRDSIFLTPKISAKWQRGHPNG